MYANLCHINDTCVNCDMWSVASRPKYSWQPTPLSLILALHLIIQWLAGHGVVKLSGFNWFSDAVASLTRVCQSVHLSLTVSSPVSQSLVLTQLCFHWPPKKIGGSAICGEEKNQSFQISMTDVDCGGIWNFDNFRFNAHLLQILWCCNLHALPG